MNFDEAHLADVNSYLSTGIHAVNGWCIPQLWQAIWPLAQMTGPGPVAEIGVYEGKFFIGLARTFDPAHAYRHAAIDVFDMQEFNIDRAGVGKAGVFDSNLEAHGVGGGIVDKLRMDSLALKPRDADMLIARHGGFKFFSVDGCHEVTHTMNDIEFAMSVIDNDGLITVDDYLNPNWPGVLEAVAKMYLLRNFAFVPLLFMCNKLFLCSYSYHETYLQTVQAYIRTHFPGTRIKTVTRFGYKTLSIIPQMRDWEDLKVWDPKTAGLAGS